MTNWDPLDEDGECSTSKDKKDAQYICDKLDIPFYDLTFVREYWLYVFQPLLKYYEYGWTPNPDVLCNRFIKFNFFANKVLRNLQQEDDPSQSSKQRCSLQVDAIATGHYCQNSFGNYLQKRSSERPFLMRSADPVKDQTFWLSTHHGLYFGILLQPDYHANFALFKLTSTELYCSQ
ncbi:unnamed protein product [Dicrocoelium dendriticum]|nr:unnamed protein product [Dicrocoelium dendriticum]